MPKRLIALFVATMVLFAFGGGFVVARSAAPAGATTTVVDVGATLRKGTSQVLYSPRGHLGPIGHFRVACGASGQATTSYRLTRTAADTLAAMSGWRASRGRKLIGSSPSMRGGSAPGGVESWLLSMGREPEEVQADVSIAVLPLPEGPGYCEFWLHGTVTVIRH